MVSGRLGLVDDVGGNDPGPKLEECESGDKQSG
jgi:hypothetical protein